MDKKAIFKRVLVKISGEALGGKTGKGFDKGAFNHIVTELSDARSLNVQTIVVVGGGNITRGRDLESMKPAAADYIGMSATITNGLMLQGYLEAKDLDTRVLSSISTPKLCEDFIYRRAIRHLEKDRIVILTGGTGVPFFTTDTAAVMRALELEADILLVGKNGVDAVYSDDPKQNMGAQRLDSISHFQAMVDQLKVMDPTAHSLSHVNSLEARVYDVMRPGNLKQILIGANIGTKLN